MEIMEAPSRAATHIVELQNSSGQWELAATLWSDCPDVDLIKEKVIEGTLFNHADILAPIEITEEFLANLRASCRITAVQ